MQDLEDLLQQLRATRGRDIDLARELYRNAQRSNKHRLIGELSRDKSLPAFTQVYLEDVLSHSELRPDSPIQTFTMKSGEERDLSIDDARELMSQGLLSEESEKILLWYDQAEEQISVPLQIDPVTARDFFLKALEGFDDHKDWQPVIYPFLGWTGPQSFSTLTLHLAQCLVAPKTFLPIGEAHMRQGSVMLPSEHIPKVVVRTVDDTLPEAFEERIVRMPCTEPYLEMVTSRQEVLAGLVTIEEALAKAHEIEDEIRDAVEELIRQEHLIDMSGCLAVWGATLSVPWISWVDFLLPVGLGHLLRRSLGPWMDSVEEKIESGLPLCVLSEPLNEEDKEKVQKTRQAVIEYLRRDTERVCDGL